jgi:V-type H+-transporting ATPase subunit a
MIFFSVVGIDPVWSHAVNGLEFINSLKMKMAVILGVTHMTIGIVVKLCNAIHGRRPLDYYFEGLPQLIFLSCLFTYACALIIMKWCISWEDRMAEGETPPDLITMFIDIVLAPGKVQNPMYGGQGVVQVMLLLIATACVLIMLVVKPLLIQRRLGELDILYAADKRDEEVTLLSEDAYKSTEDLMVERRKLLDGHESITEVWIHQMISTIEFVLGTLSHTASYLRLWALSLAHSQLSIVFLNFILVPAIKSGNIVLTIIGFMVWMAATIAVLLIMDVLECFLHALRLHWVEFQGKFYNGDGVLFEPFSLMKQL